MENLDNFDYSNIGGYINKSDIEDIVELKNIHIWMKDKRLARGLTIKELSKLSGVASKVVSSIEKGNGNTDFIAYIKIALALGYNLNFDISTTSFIANKVS